MEANLVELHVQGVAVDHANQPVVILRDEGGQRGVDIWIGPAEAVAISRELEHWVPPRPMTHDLVRDILQQLEVAVKRLIISDIRDSTYFARLVLRSNGECKEIDCRPSDGIAIALRAACPIFIPEDLLARVEEERRRAEQAREGRFIVDSGETVH